MKNINYVKVCDFLLKNPKKSTKKCKLELLDILNLKSIEEVEDIITEMIYNQILKKKNIKWRGIFYTTYVVDLTKLDIISRQKLGEINNGKVL